MSLLQREIHCPGALCFALNLTFKVFSGADRDAILRRFKVVTSDTLPPPAPEEVISNEFLNVHAEQLSKIVFEQS